MGRGPRSLFVLLGLVLLAGGASLIPGGGIAPDRARGSVVGRVPMGSRRIQRVEPGSLDRSPSLGEARRTAAKPSPDQVPEVERTGGWVRGVVVDRSGRPVAGANIVRVSADGPAIAADTDEHGEFMYLTEEGRGSVFAVHGVLGWSEPVAVDSLPGAVLVLDRSPGTVQGRVTYPDGTPAVSVAVELEFDRSAKALPTWRRRLLWNHNLSKWTVRTDGDGRFVARGVTADHWQFRLADLGVSVAGRAGDFVRLVSPRPWASVRVVDSLGVPIPSAWLEWFGWSGDAAAEARCEHYRGGVRVETLEAASCRGQSSPGWLAVGDFVIVHAAAPGYAMRTHVLDVGDRNWSTDLEIVLPPSVASGMALDLRFPDGVSPRPVLLEVMTLGAFERFLMLGRGEAARDDGFPVPAGGLLPLRPGDYRLFFRVPGPGRPVAPLEMDVTVEPGTATRTSISLQLGARLSFVIRCPDGPITGIYSHHRVSHQLRVAIHGESGPLLRWQNEPASYLLEDGAVLVSEGGITPGRAVVAPRFADRTERRTVTLRPGDNRFWVSLRASGEFSWGPLDPPPVRDGPTGRR